jgi:hypothetical protein
MLFFFKINLFVNVAACGVLVIVGV